MTTDFTFAGSFSATGIGINGLTVNAYKATRFSSAPALGASPPGGSPDATATTGDPSGFDGAFAIALPTSEDYYISVSYLTLLYWQGPVYGSFADGTAQGGTAANATIGPMGDLVHTMSVSGTALLDWATGPVFDVTMTFGTVFTFANLAIGRAMVVTLRGNFAPTWPSSPPISWQPSLPAYLDNGSGMSFEFWVTQTGEVRGAAIVGIPSSTYDAYGTSAAETTRAEDAEALLAPIASPTFTGTVTVPAGATTGAAQFQQIPVSANGYGITGNTGGTPTPAVGLAVLSGSIGGDVTFATASATKVFDTASLAPGTWLVQGAVMVAYNAAVATIEVELLLDTGTATLTGQTSGQCTTLAGFPDVSIPFNAIVVVTVTATLKVQGYNNSGSNTAKAKAATANTAAYANATGWTAVRIA